MFGLGDRSKDTRGAQCDRIAVWVSLERPKRCYPVVGVRELVQLLFCQCYLAAIGGSKWNTINWS